jgi:hypothetical protein
MATDWALEDWILDAGARAERKRLSHGIEALSPAERLVREFWILDLETRNGGVSQYFANRGVVQREALRGAWLANKVSGLSPIITEVERVIAGAPDLYRAALGAAPAIEAFYEAHRPRILEELRALEATTAGPSTEPNPAT